MIPTPPQRLSVGVAAATPTTAPKQPKKRTTVSDAQWEAEATRLLGEFPARFRPQVEILLSDCAKLNKTQTITASRRVTLLTHLEESLRQYGAEKLGRALEKTNRSGKGSPEYVRGILRREAQEESAGDRKSTRLNSSHH